MGNYGNYGNSHPPTVLEGVPEGASIMDAVFAGMIAAHGFIGAEGGQDRGRRVRVDFLAPTREAAEVAVETFGAGRVLEKSRGGFPTASRVARRAR